MGWAGQKHVKNRSENLKKASVENDKKTLPETAGGLLLACQASWRLVSPGPGLALPASQEGRKHRKTLENVKKTLVENGKKTFEKNVKKLSKKNSKKTLSEFFFKLSIYIYIPRYMQHRPYLRG